MSSLSTEALYTSYPDKHFLSNGHSDFWIQLHSFMSVGVRSFKKLVLWFEMAVAILSIQLQLILILFLLNNLQYLWCHGNCLSMRQRNILPMFVFMLTLYGWLNHVIFLLQFLLGGGADVNSMVSLKPLISSTLSYVDTALLKYSFLQDISDILLLTIDGICLVIVGGWLDNLLMWSSWLLSFLYG